MIKIINHKKSRNNLEIARKRRKISSRWAFYFTAVIFLVAIVFALFFSDFLSITSIKISGLDKLEEKSIRNTIEEKLKGKYFKMVNKNSLILLQKAEIEKALQDNFKRVENVWIKKVFPNGLRITVKERVLTMLICDSLKCYVLNERGEAYGSDNFSAEDLEGENLVVLSDVTGARISTENNPLEDDFRKFILKLASNVEDETGIVLKKQYETPSRMSGDLKVETEDGWKIYFSENVGMEKEMLMLRTVLGHKIEKERQKDLEYIDLRIANKVFYKFKEGTERMAETENIIVPEVKKEDKKKK
jgi:cell division septal protein FtsQ